MILVPKALKVKISRQSHTKPENSANLPILDESVNWRQKHILYGILRFALLKGNVDTWEEGNKYKPENWESNATLLMLVCCVCAIEKAVFLSGCGFPISRVRRIGATSKGRDVVRIKQIKSTKQL